MNAIRVVSFMLSGRRAVYLLPFTIAGLLLVVVTTIPKEVKPLTIIPRWTCNLEVRVEKKNIEYCQLSHMDECKSYVRDGGGIYLSEFLRNDQVALPDRTPFLRVFCFPACRLVPEANALTNLQVKEPSLVLNASGLSEGGGKSADFQKCSQPVHGRVKHLGDES